MEIRYVEQRFFPSEDPLFPLHALARRAVAVAARVVADPVVAAVRTAVNMPAQRRCAAQAEVAQVPFMKGAETAVLLDLFPIARDNFADAVRPPHPFLFAALPTSKTRPSGEYAPVRGSDPTIWT